MQMKVFIGCKLLPEMQNELKKAPLAIAKWEGKEYIGIYLEENPSLEKLQTEYQSLSGILSELFPDKNFGSHCFVLFPVMFIG